MSDLLNQASLVMIPSGYKEDTVYSVVPTDGSGDLSFTRASNGTRVNSAGLVEVVAWNLLEQSESIGTSPWTTPNVTITSGQTDPNGGSTAFLVVESTDGGSLRQAITQTGQLCYSIVLKYSSGTNKKASLFCTDANQQAGFDLEFGTVAYVSGSTATIESLGNGWYKCAMTFTPSTASTLILFPNYESGVGGVFAWHPQLNIGATAKPYFPTTDRLNVPRLTYQNGGGGCPSLLLEKQSTNLYFPSIPNNYANGTYVANAGISPDGTQNAPSFTPSGFSVLYSNTITTTAQSYTWSLYLKGTVNGQKVKLGSDVTTITELTLTTDWARYSVTFTASATTYGYYIIAGSYFSPAENNLFYTWGSQIEASSYPTSYIPTTSSSATRVADACSKTGISSLIGQTEGVMFVDINTPTAIPSGAEILPISLFASGAGTGGIQAYVAFLSNGTVRFVYYDGSIIQALITTASGFWSAGNRYKLAAVYKQNDFAFYINGVQIGTDNSGNVTAMADLYLDYQGTLQQNTVNQAILFKTRLTNAELASLTTI